MLINELSWRSWNSRYGYNGKENDNEVKGLGNQIDFGARIFDPRVATFLSLDPLKSQFAFQSPFIYAGNSPINSIDVNGMFKLSVENQANYPRFTELLKNIIKLASNKKIASKLFEQFTLWTGAPKENLITDLTWGEGPEICVFDMKFFGIYEPDEPGKIYISKDLLDVFEKANNKTDFNNLQFGVVTTVLHEDVHKNEREIDGIKNNYPALYNESLIWGIFGRSEIEEGEGFEKGLLGSFTLSIKPYNPLKFSKVFGIQLNFQKENKNILVIPFKPKEEQKKDEKK